ncbi:MAG: cell division protein FtsX [Legionellales bacterium]|nr:cell division protein FtsX [Legionellales bacterium]
MNKSPSRKSNARIPDHSSATKRSSTIFENWFTLWRKRHWEAFKISFNKIKRTPFATMLTVAVIGISLALPMLLLVLLRNAQHISSGWAEGTQISVFIKMDEPEDIVQQLINQLQNDPDIANVNYISPDEGLRQFQASSGFSNLQNALPTNPLPGVLEVKPAPAMQNPQAVAKLVEQLKQLPQTDVVQLDMQWVNRLYAILGLVRQAIFALAVLLGLGVILIIGNTIRLATENSKVEIDVMKLIGATNAFVRRPFLYTGVLYGLAGGIVASICTELLFWSLNSPIDKLAAAYQMPLSLSGPGFAGTMMLWLFASFLGLMGAWLVVGRYLNVRKVE